MSSDGFFDRGLTTAVFRSRSTMPVVRCVGDVRDGRQEDVKVFIKKRGGNEIEFRSHDRCTVYYF